MVVKISFRLCRPKFPREHRCGEIFRARLAVATSDRENSKRQRFPIIGRDALIRLECIAHPNQGERLRHLLFPIRIDNRAHRAGFSGRFDKLVPIKIFAAQSEEQFAAF